MHVNMIASSINIINKHNINVFAMYHFKSVMVVSYLDLCILGLLFANTGVVKIVNKCMCDDRLLDCFHHVLTYIINYEMRNILCHSEMTYS